MPAPVGVDKEELAVTYAALILHDGDQKVTVSIYYSILNNYPNILLSSFQDS